MSNTAPSVDTMIPPRLAAADAVTLARALLMAFDAERAVDARLKKAARTLRENTETLRVAWEAQVRGAIATDHGTSARRADFDEDAVWLALHAWLKGWATLPVGLAPERETAQTVLDALFPDGTGFTQLTYALEWAEADRRLAVMDADGHVARIESLGGAAMLRAVRIAHAEYERVLGMSHRAPDASMSSEGAALAPLVDMTHEALTGYITTVIQDGEGTDAGLARRETLLVPLRRWAAEQLARGNRSA